MRRAKLCVKTLNRLYVPNWKKIRTAITPPPRRNRSAPGAHSLPAVARSRAGFVRRAPAEEPWSAPVRRHAPAAGLGAVILVLLNLSLSHLAFTVPPGPRHHDRHRLRPVGGDG